MTYVPECKKFIDDPELVSIVMQNDQDITFDGLKILAQYFEHTELVPLSKKYPKKGCALIARFGLDHIVDPIDLYNEQRQLNWKIDKVDKSQFRLDHEEECSPVLFACQKSLTDLGLDNLNIKVKRCINGQREYMRPSKLKRFCIILCLGGQRELTFFEHHTKENEKSLTNLVIDNTDLLANSNEGFRKRKFFRKVPGITLYHGDMLFLSSTKEVSFNYGENLGKKQIHSNVWTLYKKKNGDQVILDEQSFI